MVWATDVSENPTFTLWVLSLVYWYFSWQVGDKQMGKEHTATFVMPENAKKISDLLFEGSRLK